VTPMIFLRTFTLALSMFVQGGIVPSFDSDVFSPKEKEEFEKADSIDRRIRVYISASRRIQKSIHQAVARGQFQSVPGDLEQWTTLLVKSLEDVETNLRPQKKSKSLIKYEIDLRKALTELDDYKIKSPIEEQDAFDACLAKAKAVHKRFVEIIFPR
jgi:hypothetical protein